MKLPYVDAASPEQITRKLITYSLNVDHPKGSHKACLFRTKLGITVDNKDFLLNQLLTQALNSAAVFTGTNQYGDRYIVDFRLTTAIGSSMVRSAWIVYHSQQYPHLVTVYPTRLKEAYDDGN